MNHFERFYATINKETVDKPATWLGLPHPKAVKPLLDYFHVDSMDALKCKIDDDIYPVELPYHSPTSDAIYAAFDFANENQKNSDERTLTSSGFFENESDPTKIDSFPWPDPEKYIDPAECQLTVNNTPKDCPVMGVIWSAHFQDTCAAFGMESALVKMILEPEMYTAIINRITDFYLKANEIFYEATKGKLHAVLIGNDFGSQTGLIVSPQLIRQYVLPGTKKLVDQAKSYGLTVIHHACGAISELIQDLVRIGVDVIHPIQALAIGMNAERLKKDFGEQVAFCGGVDAQHLLVNGTPADIKEDVRRLKELFPTGLIISPSHEVILPDVPPQNVEALFQSINERM